MGRIHLARDRRLGRDVAVKELISSGDALARRFEREARITARLSHPSIVAVHEAGTWPTGEPFYAMRLVTGRSLDEAIAAAPTFEERLALLPNVLAVADAMAYAHGQRVIHRDLKPRNVLVGEFGETVVIDWGLAKELDAEASLPPDARATTEPGSATTSAPGETTAGDVLGTPAYMPPEQAEGKAVDQRADVYAIGAMLYHVLAGAAPYAGDSSVEVLADLRAHAPPSIAARALSAPRELTAIVERAMARDPDARYPTARELADDLRRFQTGQLVGAHRYSLRQLLRRWLRRHRTAIAAVGAAAIVAIVIGVIALERVVTANRRFEDQREVARKNQKSAEDLMGFMVGDLRRKLARVGRLDIMDAVARKAADYYDARGDSGSDDDIYYSAVARDTLADVFADRGDMASRDQQVAKARALLAGLVARKPDEARYRLELDGIDLAVAGAQADHDLPGALVAYRATLADAEGVLARHPEDDMAIAVVAKARTDVAFTLERQGQIDAAAKEYRDLLAMLASKHDASEHSDKRLVDVHSSLGSLLLHAKHDSAGALVECKAELALAERQLARDPKSAPWIDTVAHAHKEVGEVLQAQNEFVGALAEARTALALAQQLVALEPTSLDYKSTLGMMEEQVGIVLFAVKDYAGALEQYRASYEIDAVNAAAQPDNLHAQRGLSVMLNKLGDIEAATKHLEEALDYYRRALAIREKLVAKAPTNAKWRRDLFYSHYELADVLDGMKRKDESLAELRTALAIAEDNAARSPTSHAALDDVLGMHDGIAQLLAERHDLAGARAEYRAAIDILRREAAEPGATAETRERLGRFEKKLAKLGGK